jgi:hypothetical protein
VTSIAAVYPRSARGFTLTDPSHPMAEALLRSSGPDTYA